MISILNYILNKPKTHKISKFSIFKNETKFTVGQKRTKMCSSKAASYGILVFKATHAVNETKPDFTGRCLGVAVAHAQTHR